MSYRRLGRSHYQLRNELRGHETRCAEQQRLIHQLQRDSYHDRSALDAADREVNRLRAQVADLDPDRIVDLLESAQSDVVRKVKDLNNLRAEHTKLQRELTKQRTEINDLHERIALDNEARGDERERERNFHRTSSDRAHARIEELLGDVRRLENQLQEADRLTPRTEGHAQLDAELEEYFERGREDDGADGGHN